MVIVELHSGGVMVDQPLEVVERKGKGHPDSVCDAVCDAISVALCTEYRKSCGDILHHNIDKGLLSAGSVTKRFGGGEVTRPMELFIGDRASWACGEARIPIAEICVETARDWFRDHFRFVDPERHVTFRVLLGRGSEELTAIFQRPGRFRPANDTSAAVGFYPLTPTESLVLNLERHLNSSGFKLAHPETGEDIKVMAYRRGRDVEVTVAMPLLAAFIDSEKAYFQKKDEVLHEINLQVASLLPPDLTLARLSLNALDAQGEGMEGIYLSLLGTSAEDADSGQVGRGNRVNGLIAVARPLGTEAAAGKNPVSHVGKIYNVLSHQLARSVCENVEGIRQAYVFLVSRIGNPIDQPVMVNVQVSLEQGASLQDVVGPAEDIVSQAMQNVGELCLELAEGRWPVC